MYVIEVTYVVPLERIDELMPAHVDWLQENFDAGRFIAAGRQEPRLGGIILAKGDRATIEEAVAQDPFGVEGAAEHRVIQFIPTRTIPELAG